MKLLCQSHFVAVKLGVPQKQWKKKKKKAEKQLKKQNKKKNKQTKTNKQKKKKTNKKTNKQKKKKKNNKENKTTKQQKMVRNDMISHLKITFRIKTLREKRLAKEWRWHSNVKGCASQ